MQMRSAQSPEKLKLLLLSDLERSARAGVKLRAVMGARYAESQVDNRPMAERAGRGRPESCSETPSKARA
jgi:hypothetical protein